jgi:DNA-nicking Smr family endonuclease
MCRSSGWAGCPNAAQGAQARADESGEVEQAMSKDDDELFRQAMRDVKRLQAPERAIESPKPPAQARFRRADERAVLQESLMVPEDAAGLLGTGEEVGFRRPHVPEAILLKLRRGQYAVDGEIDLHGLNAAQAKHALRDFIVEAVGRHWRCVRVVHGKGRRSGPGGPVLKPIVSHWLQRSNHVLAFGSARPVDGGSGAVYVLLRTH